MMGLQAGLILLTDLRKYQDMAPNKQRVLQTSSPEQCHEDRRYTRWWSNPEHSAVCRIQPTLVVVHYTVLILPCIRVFVTITRAAELHAACQSQSSATCV